MASHQSEFAPLLWARKVWPRSSRNVRRCRAGRIAGRNLRLEALEARVLLAGSPQLIGVQPNEGDLLVDGTVANIAPRDLTFRFDDGQVIDPRTLDGIQITRSGLDGTIGDGADVVIAPGFVGVNPNQQNEVVVRFAETLPDDLYQIDIFGTGEHPLRNTSGEPFNDGVDQNLQFQLNLGAQIVAVVPQPVSRSSVDLSLSQADDKVVVYFNDDDLLDGPTSAENPAFYQLIFTADTATNTDDVVHLPVNVDYDAGTDTAVLTFASPLDELSTGAGTYRLRIGTAEAVPLPPRDVAVDTDPGSSFDTAYDLDVLGLQSQLVSAAIDPESYPLEFPGSNNEPGHRNINVETHLLGPADSNPGIESIAYNFQDVYGFDPEGNVLHNLITENQKQRSREIFQLYNRYLGLQFVETAVDGLTIVTGDLRALSPTVPTGPGGVIGIAGGGVAVMDQAETWNDEFGASDDPNRLSWFDTAMHEIGHLLGLGHTYELAPFTVMGDDPGLNFSNTPEPVFPGDHDIAHGLHLHRAESNDIDLYRFELDGTGLFSAETIAERRTDSSLLDTALNLYQENSDGSRTLLARNDDYFSEDSFIEMGLGPGTYYVGVSSTGNLTYDPTIEGTGIGGTTQGPYDLRLNFRPDVLDSIVDADRTHGVLTPTPLDGDANGVPGGVYNFWFRVQSPSFTLFVDKSHTPTFDPIGTLDNPFQRVSTAFSAAEPGDIVRIVGNDQNMAYEVGFNSLGQPLEDGARMNVPLGVTVMVDAGAIFKLRRARISVGSSAPEVDRSAGALQVLGTPLNTVFFTSFSDPELGANIDPNDTVPEPGDWGGLVFRADLDKASGHFDYAAEGVFLNYVNHADVRYGGGSVVIDSIEQTITPIHMTDSRPTVSFNTITLSADAAMSANPDSFEETNFHAPQFQAIPFTSDYDRVGPDIHGNRLVRQVDGEVLQNTTNGLFIRIQTAAGEATETLTVAGRWDDTDIVHVVEENLVIEGTPGGPVGTPIAAPPDAEFQDRYDLRARLDARLAIDPAIVVKLDGVRIETTLGAQLIAEARDGLSVIFTSVLDDRFGAGGTFDTTGDGDDGVPTPGDWGGLVLKPASTGSIDHALFAYGGGVTTIEGTFAGFNTVEVHQAQARITNSVFENNANGIGGQSTSNRGGRGPNAPGAIFIRGAQPVIVDNVIRNTSGDNAAAINVNANALSSRLLPDYGRSRGPVRQVDDFRDNQGPLIRDNRLADNQLNGMIVRGATLTKETVWDDTDIVHVLLSEIVVPDFHTSVGLRLESSPTESLVVKVEAERAGFRTTGKPLDIVDRIGGMLHIIGQPGRPVVITSLADDSVGAGFQPDSTPQTDTDMRLGALPLPERTGQFDIQLELGPTLAANPTAAASIERAAELWESLIDDPITIVLDAEFGPLTGPAGQTQPVVTALFYDNVLGRMIADASPHEELVNEIPSFSRLRVVLPDDPTAPYGVVDTMSVTRANALALGVDVPLLPQLNSQFNPDPTIYIDATITFNDNQDLPGADVFGVALHEMAHALGFITGESGVDAGNRIVSLTPLDMFRLAPGAGQVDFSNSPRILDPQLDQVFYDGGIFNPAGIPIADIARGDIPMSTGEVMGDGWQPSHWKDDAQIGGINLGLMDPSGGPLNYNDKRALDLIGWDLVDVWQGIVFDTYTHDRNVETVTELEAPNLTAPGTNATPDNAQFVGDLAPNEKAGDDSRRLGFDIHGFLSQPADVDVYSFKADAGTEVWLDIDNTTSSLDTVVELINADGQVLARSDNSYAEGEEIEPLFSTQSVTARPLDKSPFLSKDNWTINLHDAGMRLLLPGPLGTTNTYHVRVRSSSPDLDANLAGGLTSGVYQLQIRIGEQDELPGSSVQFADIRYAINGIEVLGQPIHSPLLGEVAENGTFNGGLSLDGTLDGSLFDAQGNIVAQNIGNVLTSDRAVISVAGDLALGGDIDWYQVDLIYDSTQSIADFSPDTFVGTIFDIDYADGAAGANTYLAVYRPILDADDVVVGAELVLSGTVSDILDDQPAPFEGADPDDLSRGSFGKLDASIGTVELAAGTYFVAVTSNTFRPQELADQYLRPDPSNPLVRVEPVDSLVRVAEDHTAQPIETPFDLESPFAPPQVPGLLGEVDDFGIFDPDAAIVPFNLGDVTLFVSQDFGLVGNTDTTVSTIDPFTGAVETTLGSFDGQVGDVAMRPDGNLYAFSIGLNLPGGPTDDNSGNLFLIDTGTASAENLGDDGIETYALNEEGDSAERSNDGDGDGIQFNAMTFGEVDGLNLFAAGDRGFAGALAGPAFDTNILYQFDPSEFDGNGIPPGTAIPTDPVREDEDFIDNPGAMSNVFERGQIVTDIDVGGGNTVLQTVKATVLKQDATVYQIFDGLTYEVDGNTFEMNSGPEVRINFDLPIGEFFREGDRFTLDGALYEFDTGPVLTFSGTGLTLRDGDTFTIDNQTFELENELIGDGVAPGNKVILFDSTTSVTNFRETVVTVINNTGGGGFDVKATDDLGGRVTLINDSSLSFSPGFVGITPEGDYGPQFGGATIAVEETSTPSEVRQAIVDHFTNVPGITAATEAERVNFQGAISGDFSTAIYMVDQGSDGNVGAGNVPVPFLATDSANDIAQGIATAITGALGTGATATNAIVTLNGGTFTAAEAPLVIGGAAPGGTVTGLAILGGELYAVSDAGGLFKVGAPTSDAITTDYIETGVDLLDIPFTSLAAGPLDVEDGAYAEMLFAADADGNLHAFNTDGELQPIFVDGDTGIALLDATGAPLTDIHGVAFSTLDENLWHVTDRRDGDAGHGIDIPVTLSRSVVVDGGVSFYFGNEDDTFASGNPTGQETQFDYNYPGGAHGSLQTAPIDLANYSVSDQPFLYFNYFLATENAATNGPLDDYNPDANPVDHHRDSLRVYIADNSTQTGDGQWQLLATNDSFRDFTRLDEFDSPFGSANNLNTVGENYGNIQELFDSTGTWRQARIPLGEFAGSSNLQLRFDFSTAGSLDKGSAFTGGSDLRALPGSQLRDGQVFVIGTPNRLDPILPPELEIFEFDLGYTLVSPEGSTLADGETFTLDNGVDPVVLFEFDSDGDADPASISVPFQTIDSAGAVALNVQRAIIDSGLGGVLTYLSGNRVNLQGNLLVTQKPAPGSATPGLFLDGSPGTIVPEPDHHAVPVHAGMTVEEVVDAIRQSLADVYAGGAVDTIKSLGDTVYIIGHTVEDPGPLGASGYQAGEFALFGGDPILTFGAFSDSGPPQITRYPGSLRGMDNIHEGVYVDDLIIGFAERGEMVTGAGDNSTFVPNVAVPNNEIVSGSYQLEVRRGADYGVATPVPPLTVLRSFDTNDRLSESFALLAPAAEEIVPGQTFTLSDGVDTVTFEYVDRTILEENDTIPDAFESGLTGGTDATYVGIGGIGDNHNAAPGLDVDLLAVDLAAGDLLAIDIDTFNASPLVPYLRLFDATGAEVANSAGQAAPGEPPSLDPFLFFQTPDDGAGTYYVGVSGSDTLFFFPVPNADYDPFVLGSGSVPSSASGDYQIEVTLNAGGPPSEGNMPLGFASFDPAQTVADRIARTINSSEVQVGRGLDVTAVSLPTSNRIDLFGETVVIDIQPIVVDETTTDANALRDAILGEGITPVGDATFVGSDVSAGLFHGGSSSVGIEAGILLTTGDARFAEGPNLDDGSSGLASGSGDADLDAEFDVETTDTSVLEFSFTSDTEDLFFNFVFASEEYNEFANTEFNDVFAFFLDGENIALVPGTTDPISINTINGGNPVGVDAQNELYYNNNSLLDNGAFLDQIGYDGFTNVFTATKTGLGPGTHTIKLAISDVADTALDSGVFIAAGSFEADRVPPDAIGGIRYDEIGDPNRHRDQGQLVIRQSTITESAQFGIVADAAPRDGTGNLPHQGPPRNLPETNTERLVPGVTITNNIISRSGRGGIHLSGEPVTADAPAVPFARVINNTLFGHGGTLIPEFGHTLTIGEDVGILVDQNASPTLLNNIVANFEMGIDVDSTSQTTVLGGVLLQGNTVQTNYGQGDFPILLDNIDPLFVAPGAGNFYLEANSSAIDSSIDSLEDRLELVSVKAPLGIPPSPILTPVRDVTGLKRVDDPSVEPPEGVGENVFKDRGALDRADFVGPTANLIAPQDNDAAGRDQNPTETIVQLPGGVSLAQFSIQLSDGVEPADPQHGTGVDPNTVTGSTVTVRRISVTSGAEVTLVEGIDYTFNYDTTNHIIRLTPLAGVWETDNGYVILLDNSVDTGVNDIAGNPLKPNQTDGRTVFGITLGGLRDFGDAPDPSFPTLLANDGARHEIIDGFFLGATITSEIDGQPSPGADADPGDDGVVFDTPLLVGSAATLTVTATAEGFLDAWIDFDGDGSWDQPGDNIFASELLSSGANSFTINVPEAAQSGPTYARFRFSSSGGLLPSGEADDGEVEDYLVLIGSNPWQNSPNPLNVDNDPNDSVDPIDALVVINELNDPKYSDPTTGELPVPPPIPPGSTQGPPFFYDVNGDGFATPIDALMVINFLNAAPQAAVAAVAAMPESDLPVDLISVQASAAAQAPAESLAVAPSVVTAAPRAARRARGATGEAAQRVDRFAQAAQVEPRQQPRRTRLVDRDETEFDRLLTDIAEEIDAVRPSDNTREAVFARLA